MVAGAGLAQETTEVVARLRVAQDQHVGEPGAAQELGVLRIAALERAQVAKPEPGQLPAPLPPVEGAGVDRPSHRRERKGPQPHLPVRVPHGDRAHTYTHQQLEQAGHLMEGRQDRERGP